MSNIYAIPESVRVNEDARYVPVITLDDSHITQSHEQSARAHATPTGTTEIRVILGLLPDCQNRKFMQASNDCHNATRQSTRNGPL